MSKKILSKEEMKELVRTIPDWPKQGIMFRDITTLCADGEGMRSAIYHMVQQVKDLNIDVVVGIEARGFIFGPPVAMDLGVGFVLARKPRKLPGKTISVTYNLEYGTDKIEMHEGSIKPGQRALVIDDLIATGMHAMMVSIYVVGGTLSAACQLVELAGGVVAACQCLIELPDLHGREHLKQYNVLTVLDFGGH